MEILDALICSHFTTSLLESKLKKWQIYAIYIIQTVFLRIVLNPIWQKFSIRSPIMLAICFLTIILMFKGAMWRKILCFLTYIVSCLNGEILGYFVVVQLLKINIDVAYKAFSMQKLLYQFIVYTVIYFSSLIGIRILRKKALSLDEKSVHCITAYIFIQLLSVLIIFNAMIEYKINSPEFLVTAILIIILSIILGCVLVKNLVNIVKIKRQKEFAEEEIYIRDKHYMEMHEQYKEYRQLRHDFADYIGVLRTLQDKGEKEEVNDLIQILQDKFDVVNSVIYCNNAIIDALIFSKNVLATEHEIKTSYNLVDPPANVISDFDLCGIISNMLCNAIEGAKCSCAENKYLHMETFFKLGFFVIVVKNSSNPIKDNLKTTKDEKKNHGFGVEIIKCIAEKYDGNAIFQYEDGEFTCIVNLKCR